MLYLTYLDEFGHIGPYVGRSDPAHNDSPVFGLAGIVLPYHQVRPFSTWFFQLKCKLLKWEIDKSGQHAAVWEKKGSSLFTTKNIEKYGQVRRAANRVLNKIRNVGGFVFFVGVEKTEAPEASNPRNLYLAVLKEAMKRLNDFGEAKDVEIAIVIDEHQDRDAILTKACQEMFGSHSGRRRIIEPPFQVESHRYQTCQCADWICGLIGRLGAYRARPNEWSDMEWAKLYFENRLQAAAERSGIRSMARAAVIG